MRIEQARKSKSGKTLSVLVAGQWYQSKEWELENMVGEDITITDTNASEYNGKTIHWLNAYVVGAPTTAPAPAAMKTPSAITDAATNVLLLNFIGQCMQSFQWQTSDLVVAKTRARQCYELGQSILDGSIMQAETGPRRKAGHTVPPLGGDDGSFPAAEDDFDDDIPF